MQLTTAIFAAGFVVGLAQPRPAEHWTVRPDGVGPVRVGMTVRALSDALHQSVVRPASGDEHDCFYVEENSKGINVMVLHGRVGRIDVDSVGPETSRGIRVGDSEAKVRSAYPQGLSSEPSYYDGDAGGKYLTFRDAGSKDAVRFEVFDGKVTSYYAGSPEAIELVEGCS